MCLAAHTTYTPSPFIQTPRASPTPRPAPQEASDADLHALQAELRQNYAALMAATLRSGKHAPLDEAEAAALGQAQQALLSYCEGQFREVFSNH